MLTDNIRADLLSGRSSIRQACDRLEDETADLEARLEEARGRGQRSPLNKQVHRNRQLIAWLKTRAGY